jgi:hypothetical protein
MVRRQNFTMLASDADGVNCYMLSYIRHEIEIGRKKESVLKYRNAARVANLQSALSPDQGPNAECA